ncbi:hypothetical protein [Microbacterium sp. CGR1]|uniref:hypothetical protein n=1 Tax=Microbacterium sp. CGR1 TaxID=1696072 RepID=UPI003DA48452
MTDDENDGEETVILTRRDRRRGGAVADAPPAPSAPSAPSVQSVPTDVADVADVADEDARSEDSTDGTDVEVLDEATVVVDRSAGPVAEPAGTPDDDAEVLDEATVVVDRSAGVVEEPAGTPDDELVEEATVVVSRPPRPLRRKRKKGADEQDDAPVDPASTAAPISFEAPTDVRPPEIYRPRPAPLGPSAPPIVAGAAAPTRAVDPELPSVAKQGLRWSMATLLAFAVACAVSVAGLVTLGFVVFA